MLTTAFILIGLNFLYHLITMLFKKQETFLRVIDFGIIIATSVALVGLWPLVTEGWF